MEMPLGTIDGYAHPARVNLICALISPTIFSPSPVKSMPNSSCMIRPYPAFVAHRDFETRPMAQRWVNAMCIPRLIWEVWRTAVLGVALVAGHIVGSDGNEMTSQTRVNGVQIGFVRTMMA